MQIDYIKRLLLACETGKIPDDVARWLHSGLDRHIQTGQDLGACLGLSGPGQESIYRRFLRSERNRHIRLAIDAAGVGCEMPEKIRRTSELIIKFESRIWPRHQTKAKLPEHYPEAEKCLFRAFQIGLPVPSSVKQLQRIVSDSWT